MEVSSYIHPPFKIAMSRSSGLGVKNVVKFRTPDVSQGTRVFVVEFCYQFRSEDFGGRLPGIVFAAISFPLNEVLESSPVPTTVEYLFHFPFCFSVDDYGQWVVRRFPSWNWVIRSWSELHYVEHWVELLHPVWQF